ncbi:hypothetical protein BLNAU_2784 [Blattamonas nauphoetae]|uniref:Uncharacterized protein n=1 Tax=Blattamonas nauphoetae TaxID=2049346 RepID=A0ABQ9YEH3_9EUKA|nr:hypothetical protein BLNAU_2784 [Blattamonas nauphoetae]
MLRKKIAHSKFITQLLQSLSQLHGQLERGDIIKLLQCVTQACNFQEAKDFGYQITENQNYYAKSLFNTDSPTIHSALQHQRQ